MKINGKMYTLKLVKLSTFDKYPPKFAKGVRVVTATLKSTGHKDTGKTQIILAITPKGAILPTGNAFGIGGEKF